MGNCLRFCLILTLILTLPSRAANFRTILWHDSVGMANFTEDLSDKSPAALPVAPGQAHQSWIKARTPSSTRLSRQLCEFLISQHCHIQVRVAHICNETAPARTTRICNETAHTHTHCLSQPFHLLPHQLSAKKSQPTFTSPPLSTSAVLQRVN